MNESNDTLIHRMKHLIGRSKLKAHINSAKSYKTN